MTFKAGFSLAECLIAMALLTITGLSSLKLYRYLEIEKANSSLWAKASQIAQSKISQLQQVNSNFVCDDGKQISFVQIEHCLFSLPEKSLFKLETRLVKTLTDKADNEQQREIVKILSIELGWVDRKGVAQQLSMPVAVTISSNLF